MVVEDAASTLGRPQPSADRHISGQLSETAPPIPTTAGSDGHIQQVSHSYLFLNVGVWCLVGQGLRQKARSKIDSPWIYCDIIIL